jgi:hypothetical protein
MVVLRPPQAAPSSMRRMHGRAVATASSCLKTASTAWPSCSNCKPLPQQCAECMVVLSSQPSHVAPASSCRPLQIRQSPCPCLNTHSSCSSSTRTVVAPQPGAILQLLPTVALRGVWQAARAASMYANSATCCSRPQAKPTCQDLVSVMQSVLRTMNTTVA